MGDTTIRTPHQSGANGAAPAALSTCGAGVTVDAVDLAAVFAALPSVDLLIAADPPRWTMLAATDARLAATMTTREGTLGRPLFDVFPDANPDNAAASGVGNLRASLDRVLATRAPDRMPVQRYDLRRPDGTWEPRWWEPLNVPVLAADGTVRYLLHRVEDVTARVRADAERAGLEATLTAERAQGIERERTRARAERLEVLEAVFERSPTFLHVLRGPDFVFEFANTAYYTLVGQRDLIGRPAFEALPEAAAGGFPERLARVLATGEPFVGRELPVMLARTPGAPAEERLVDLLYVPLVDADGRRTRVLGHGVDVTDTVRARQRSEAALAAERARATDILETVSDAYFALDAEFRLVAVNAAMERNVALPRSALLGRTMWDVFPGTTGNAFEAAYRRAATAREASHFTHAYADGRLDLVTEVDVYPAPGGGVAVFWRDVTARHRAEAERERLLRAAEAANRAKSEFLAVMSHELRTPLNAIGGYAELLELGVHGPVTEAQRAALGRIQQSQRHLLGLIAGVLDYSRVEAGAVTYRLTAVPVAEALAEAEALVAPQLRAKGLVYRCDAVPADLCVRADREKLQQVLLNLLGNAIKFTDARDGVPGRIALTCEVTAGGAPTDAPGAPTDAPDASEGMVRLRVRDTGVGIAPERLADVFEPFVQVDQGLTRTHAGVGLGLAISRDLARGMGGDLRVESRLGEGSTFTLTLPLEDETAAVRVAGCSPRSEHATHATMPSPHAGHETRGTARASGAPAASVATTCHGPKDVSLTFQAEDAPPLPSNRPLTT